MQTTIFASILGGTGLAIFMLYVRPLTMWLVCHICWLCGYLYDISKTSNTNEYRDRVLQEQCHQFLAGLLSIHFTNRNPVRLLRQPQGWRFSDHENHLKKHISPIVAYLSRDAEGLNVSVYALRSGTLAGLLPPTRAFADAATFTRIVGRAKFGVFNVECGADGDIYGRGYIRFEATMRSAAQAEREASGDLCFRADRESRRGWDVQS